MKNKLINSLLVMLMVSIILSCTKGDNASSISNTISISNNGNNTYGGTSYQFTSLELTPTDGSSSKKTYTFVSTFNTTISVVADLPKVGSYKIVIYANNSVGYLQWNSIALSKGGTTTIFLYCPGNMSYKDGSTAAGIAPDISNGL